MSTNESTVDFYSDDNITYLCNCQLNLLESVSTYQTPQLVEFPYTPTIKSITDISHPTQESQSSPLQSNHPPARLYTQPHLTIPDLHTTHTVTNPDTHALETIVQINGSEFVSKIALILDIPPSTDSPVLDLIGTYVHSKQYNYLVAPVTHPYFPQYGILTTEIDPIDINYTIKLSELMAKMAKNGQCTKDNNPMGFKPTNQISVNIFDNSTANNNTQDKPPQTLPIAPISQHPTITLPAQTITTTSTIIKLSPALLQAYMFANHADYLNTQHSNHIRYHPIKDMIFFETGWANYLTTERIVLPLLPLTGTIPQIQNLIQTIDGLFKLEQYKRYTTTPQMAILYKKLFEWFEDISQIHRKFNSLPEPPLKFHFPSNLFQIIYFPIALLYDELLLKNSKLSFTQLIPFSLPPPYHQSDSISLFISLILITNSSFNQSFHHQHSKKDKLIQSTANTPDPITSPIQSILHPETLLADREKETGVIEPNAADRNAFINTHNPRLSATLVFSPLDCLCTCGEESFNGNDGYSYRNDVHGEFYQEENSAKWNFRNKQTTSNRPPLYFQFQQSNPHVSSTIPSSYTYLQYDSVQNSSIPSSLINSPLVNQTISPNTHNNWFSRIFTPTSVLFKSELAYRWLGLNVKQIAFTPQLFHFNQHNVPIISRQLQQIIHLFSGQLSTSIYIIDEPLTFCMNSNPQLLSGELLSKVHSPLTHSIFWPKHCHPPTTLINDNKPSQTYQSGMPVSGELNVKQYSYVNISEKEIDTILTNTLFYNPELISTRYHQFLSFLSASIRHTLHTPPFLTYEGIFESPFRDELQVPLQPLGHQLENATYEVFERDPVKYRNYRLAVEQMLIGLNQQIEGKSQNDASRGETQTDQPPNAFHLCVLGAGRGPLVQCCIEASINTNIPIQLTAIEKNPFAYCSLLQRVNFAGGWGNGNCFSCQSGDDSSVVNNPHQDLTCKCPPNEQNNWSHVRILQSDMRDIINTNRNLLLQPDQVSHCNDQNGKENKNERPLLFHIVVSELLGSFGDNELSPECLFGVEWLLTRESSGGCDLLNPQNPLFNIQGYSIPNQSRSYLAPVTANDVYNGIIGHNIGTAVVETKKSHAEKKLDPIEKNEQIHSQLIPKQDNIGIVAMNKMLHTPYVTLLHNHSILSRPQECFQFWHPDQPPITINNTLISKPSTTMTPQSAKIISSTSKINPLDNNPSISPVPIPTYNVDNLNYPLCRYNKMTFYLDPISSNPSEQTGNSIIHGFAGYFDSILFDPLHIQHHSSKITPQSHEGLVYDHSSKTIVCNNLEQSNTIGISTLPETYSHGMFSWFPLFFPLQIPIIQTTLPTILVDNIERYVLDVEMWRKCDGKRVWYEYNVIHQGIIHNIDGIAYSIGLVHDSDLI